MYILYLIISEFICINRKEMKERCSLAHNYLTSSN